MLLPPAIAAAVASGEVQVAFRRWKRPRVRVGGTFLTSAGLIEVTGVEQVDPERITDSAARAAGLATADELRKLFRGDPTDPVFRVGLAYAGPDPRLALGDDTALTDADIADISMRLGRLDRASTHGAWTSDTLRLIEANPAVRAADLAESVGRERDPFKIDVRKLKKLGLTRSLEVGYRLSPRGAAYLAAIERGDR
ncbi:hypothetical protein [Solicola gregarius]|uniref:ASCH domain-containing protein n=1 Tax=Solicola gregarius TaxID=2908642 RepID=A0AA46TEA6_9ACTN|nr:hypothetical protein [Solicola gregarius]UYM03456.1 hypothetical protein L0C25_12905 [Solicola gregarius]